MSSTSYNQTFNFSPLTSRQLANLCGILHENIKVLEGYFNLNIKVGYDEVMLTGGSTLRFTKVKKIIEQLHKLSDNPIPKAHITTLLYEEDSQIVMVPIKLSRKTISPKNAIQANFLEGISNHPLTIAVGPAGTGKTYLAVSKAIEYFERGEVQRLIFVRPAVEAGEKLGFLPGDMIEKVLPYLRPIYDALYEMIGFKETQKLIQNDVIEILPLAFMRGRTLNEAFIILDEAQNTTISQMKMFLTRMGFGSKTVITGDATQMDLPKNIQSGLSHAIKVLGRIEDISIHKFSSQEVVRHPLVSQIIDCYDKFEKEKK